MERSAREARRQLSERVVEAELPEYTDPHEDFEEAADKFDVTVDDVHGITFCRSDLIQLIEVGTYRPHLESDQKMAARLRDTPVEEVESDVGFLPENISKEDLQKVRDIRLESEDPIGKEMADDVDEDLVDLFDDAEYQQWLPKQLDPGFARWEGRPTSWDVGELTPGNVVELIETGSTIGGWEDEPWVFKVTQRGEVPFKPIDYPHPDMKIDIDEAVNFYSLSTKY